MAPYFVFPQNLKSLEEENDDNRLHVLNPTDVASLRLPEVEEFVKGVSFDLSDKEIFCIEEQEVFDNVYSVVKGFSSLTPSGKVNLVESLRSNLSVLLPNVDSLLRVSQGQDDDNDNENEPPPVLDRVSSYRNALKIYTFFLFSIVLSEESSASSNSKTKMTGTNRKKQLVHSWNWEPQRGRILNLIANSLEINLALLFGSTDPDENYLSFITKIAFGLFESATLIKDSETKDALCRIIGACATKYHYTAQSCASIMHLVHKYDYVVTHMADAVARAEKKYADGTLASSLIREIGRSNPKAYVKDTVGAENVGRFLVELADRLPKLISTNIGVLVPHFGGESYKIRNALVGVLGKLVAKAFKDFEGDVSSNSVRLRTKQAMLEILLERCRDVSAYTRSRVLQVWAELCEEHSVSIGLWNEVAAVAAGRLEDKSAIVRKAALNLLIMMLQHNPFGPQLRIASFQATLEQYNKKLNELEPDKCAESVLDGLQSDNETYDGGEVHNGIMEEPGKEQQESLTDSVPNLEEGIPQKDSSVPDIGNLEQTRALVASLEAGLIFSKCVSATMPTLVQLMASSSATDVENTILLLMRCKQFQIDGAEACLRKMLPLVFSQDKSIYEAVENAFVTIYVRKNPVDTAKNLLNLAIDSNIGDLAALEFIVNALVSKGDISSSTISALWDFFCFNISGTTADQSRGALSVLCMAAKSSSGVLGSHLQDIIDIGFGRWAKVDPLLARTACIAIQRLSEEDKKKLLASNGSRVFGFLENLISGVWLPENTCGGDDLQNDIESSSADILTTVQVARISRYLFVVSHVAMNQLLYIETCVRKIQKQKLKRDKLGANGIKEDDTPKDNINAELGVSASEEAILDTLSERAEKEILAGGSNEKYLIGLCAPFLTKLCRNFSLMQKYPDLQASGMLALCRFMIIDPDFCDANLQLLFTVVESASSETVRSNCTIALGDLAVRFPNLLEPWTENMYARLRDPSVSVRKNAVLVLSHLILNDMMKVKGYINEMAIRLEDEQERISNLAKLFFHELSKKGSNPIYNLLPDILGKLSNQELKRETFCNIMQFLIGSIKKDKQMESLVEKLCNRFCGVTDTRQWEYISYCLSQLAFTEKGMKKLIDSFKTFEHVLSEDSVMDNFKSIITKAKKFAKPELKLCIEEFEEKLTKFHMEKKEQEVTARNAQIHQQKISGMEGCAVARNEGEVSEGSDIIEDGEINDPSMEEIAQSSDSEVNRSGEYSGTSSEVTDMESDGTEVQSKVASKSRATESKAKVESCEISSSTRRSTRSKQKDRTLE
ncbi:hypothetical protein OIU76_010513 [Salix suchowensis]|nr:hypothetical protein OIU76_010513 [Salix suchowensis]